MTASDAAARAEEVTRAFFAAWETHDLDRITGDLAEDCLFVNGSVSTVRGAGAIRDLYAAYLAGYDSFRFVVTSAAVAADGVSVHNERMDYMVQGDLMIEIPCAGVVVVIDGRITEIRDYFDFGAVQAQRAAYATGSSAADADANSD